ncbi:HlyD family type I secretion periplasmic adaptor subunit [Morganella psychrotolerans]
MDNKKETPVISEDALAKLQEQMRGMSGGNPAAEEKKPGFFKRVINGVKDFCYITSKKDSELYTIEDSIDDAADFGLVDDVKSSKANRMVLAVFAFFILMFIWAWLSEISEVTKGSGKVIPSSKEQIIQSLDGGIITYIAIKEGDIVQAGQTLAMLDSTRTTSNLEESVAKYNTALAASVRLQAEVDKNPSDKLLFPDELDNNPALKEYETKLWISRKHQFNQTIANLQKSQANISRQLNINRQLEKAGASSVMDILRLEKELIDLRSKEEEYIANFYVTSHQELAKIMAEVNSLTPLIKGRQDYVSRTVITSPVKGIVKNIQTSTIGGVVPPNGILMDIVPLEDTLIIEAKISPKDIAFIHPGQTAKVKITAYDYAIFGGLEGVVHVISPDTVKDEVKSDVTWYRIYVQTQSDHLVNKSGQSFAITPGMIATIEITTGSKTVLQYLIKPFNKVNEALRER